MTTTLAWCAANNMYVVLDLHAAPGSQGTDANIRRRRRSPCDFWNQADQPGHDRAAVGHAGRPATKTTPRVAMYDLINEPNNVPEQRQHAFTTVLQRLINAVRAQGDNHLHAARRQRLRQQLRLPGAAHLHQPRPTWCTTRTATDAPGLPARQRRELATGGGANQPAPHRQPARASAPITTCPSGWAKPAKTRPRGCTRPAAQPQHRWASAGATGPTSASRAAPTRP
ncbi:MAG: cellulase family glycosylhydrolase [Hymenobacter sp.]